MSLEEALAENTAALKALTAALAKGGATVGSVPAKAVAPAAKPAVAAKPAAKLVAKPAAKAAAEEEAEGITYEKDVRPLILELGKAGKRESIASVLANFGVEKGPELTEEQWEEARDLFQAELDA